MCLAGSVQGILELAVGFMGSTATLRVPMARGRPLHATLVGAGICGSKMVHWIQRAENEER